MKLTDLRAGDVLLYHTEKYIPGVLIQRLDDSDWYHSGLYFGPGDGSTYQVVEGIAEGVVVQDLKVSVKDSNKLLVRRLKEDVPDMKPVILKAQDFVGSSYSFHDLFFLAVICLFKQVNINAEFNDFLRDLLELASDDIDKIFASGVDKQPMICSSFVYRSYNEACPEEDDSYTIRISEEVGTYATRLFAATSKKSGSRGFTDWTTHQDCILSEVISQLSNKSGDINACIASTETNFERKIDKTHNRSIALTSLQRKFDKYCEACTPEQKDKHNNRAQRISAETAEAVRAFTQKLRFSFDAQTTVHALEYDMDKNLASSQASPEDVNLHISPLHTFKDTFANFVTPKDLSLSDSLRDVGVLEQNELAKL